jgi:hypothetical protein
MPLDDRGRLHQDYCIQTARPQPIEANPEQAVDSGKTESAGAPSPENSHLMP